MNKFPQEDQASKMNQRLLGASLIKKAIPIALISITLGTLFGYSFFSKNSRPPEKKLQFVQCDVGQGDAIYLNFEGYELLVDGGPDKRVLQCLSKFRPANDDTLEVVVATHPDADHISGLVEVLTRHNVGVFLWNGDGKETKIYQRLEEVLKNKAISTQVISAGDQIRMRDVMVQVLWPEKQDIIFEQASSIPGEKKKESKKLMVDTNARSIVLQVKFGDFNALLSGDLPEKEEESLLSLRRLEPVTWLKVGHHGSAHSSSRSFLHVLRPEVCTIGVGKNAYGHPTQTVLEALQEVGCQVWRTDTQGDIWGSSDGHTLRMFSP